MNKEVVYRTAMDPAELEKMEEGPVAREILGVLGYDSVDNLYNDLSEYSEEKDSFTAKEFAEEYSLESSGSVEEALSLLEEFAEYENPTNLE